MEKVETILQKNTKTLQKDSEFTNTKKSRKRKKVLRRTINPENKTGSDIKLDNNLSFKIRSLILKGKKVQEIQEELNISSSSWENWYWRNAKGIKMETGFRDLINNFRLERKRNLASDNLDHFLSMETRNVKELRDGDTTIVEDPQLVRIKADATKFTLERLSKEDYSIRSEVTGKNGEKLEIIPILGGLTKEKNVSSNNNTEEDTKT